MNKILGSGRAPLDYLRSPGWLCGAAGGGGVVGVKRGDRPFEGVYF